MANPTEGPFPPAAKSPEFGDPEILPKGRIERPSRERIPFGPSGELLPEGPALPADYLQAPDVAKLPWTRKRGDEWTDATFRQVVLTFISQFVRARDWARRWDVRERATSERMSSNRLPRDQEYLVIGITQADGQRVETSAPFPVTQRDATSARVILDQMGAALDAVQASL